MNLHSFVVLAYKESPYLEDCLKSLQAQSMQSEIVISTSTPNVYITRMAEKYNCSVKVNSGPSGIANDWNFALQCVNSQYVTLAHQDDIYAEDFWSTVRSVLLTNEELLIVFTGYQEFDDCGIRKIGLNIRIKNLILGIFFGSGNVIRSQFRKTRLLSVGSPICCPSVTYHTLMLKEFQFNPEFTINLDWEAWLRMSAMKGGFGYEKTSLMMHRIHVDSETSIGLHENRRQLEDTHIIRSLWPYPISPLISWLYRASYSSNKVK